MKYLAILFVLLPVFYGIQAQNTKQEYFLYTNAQSLSRIQAVTTWENEFLGKSTLTVTLTYDKKGKITAMNEVKYSYQKNKTLYSSKTLFDYDSQGRLLKEVYQKDEKKLLTTQYQYSRERLSQKLVYDHTDKTQKIWNYDPKGTILSYRTYLPAKGVSTDGYTNTLDEQGNIIRMQQYNFGRLSSITHTHYNGQQLAIQSLTSNSSGQLLSIMDYSYDDKDNLTGLQFRSTYTPVPTLMSYDYDRNGHKIKEDNGYQIIEYSYHKNGNPAKKVTKKTDGTITEIRKYNDKGQLIHIEDRQTKGLTLIQRDYF